MVHGGKGFFIGDVTVPRQHIPEMQQAIQDAARRHSDALLFIAVTGHAGDGNLHPTTYLPRPKSSGGWFAAAVNRAKIQNITPHDLRHTCASLAVGAGVNVLALQRMLGHTSAKVTLDTSGQ